MIILLFCLSYFTAYIIGETGQYFQSFPFLKYGFNEVAAFYISFTNVDNKFVFGLATEKEIKEIEKIKNDQEYCQGLKNISKIQYVISKNEDISGSISSKTILTPYIFSCEQHYFLYINFDYSNGENNLDYRLQSFMKFAEIFPYFSLLATILFSSYIIYIGFRLKYLFFQIYYITKKFLLISISFMVLFSLLCAQAFHMLEFYSSRSGKEYFNIHLIDSFDFDLPNIIELDPDNYIIELLIYITLYSIIVFVQNDSPVNCKSVMYLMGISIFLALHIAFQILGYNNICEIINVISFVLFSLLYLLSKPIYSIIKLGMLIQLVGCFIIFPIGKIIIFVTQYDISTHYMCMILSIIFIIIHCLSIICYLLSFFYFKEFEFESDQIIIFKTIHIQIKIENCESVLTGNNIDESSNNSNRKESNIQLNAFLINQSIESYTNT